MLELRGSRCHKHHIIGGRKEEDVPGDEREHGFNKTVAVIRGLPADRIQTIVGDTCGILCALTMDGELWLLDEMDEMQGEAPELTRATDGSIVSLLSWVRHDLDFGALQASGGFPAKEKGEEREVVIDQIAVAGNDRVCISTHTRKTRFSPVSKSAHENLSNPLSLTIIKGPTSASSSNPSSPPSTLLTFPSFSSLLSSSPTIIATATLPMSPTSLLGSSTTFQALCGSVPYTWGDARYATLGRNPSPDHPADTPNAVAMPPLAEDDLEPHVQKVAAGGWLAASIFQGGDCYIWGGRLGERERSIGGLAGDEEDELLRFVDVEGGQAEVVDVAVGHGWVLVLTKAGKVWGWGDGRWGQLGMKGDESGWVQGWVEVGGWEGMAKKVVGVACGAWNSFVLIRSRSEEE